MLAKNASSRSSGGGAIRNASDRTDDDDDGDPDDASALLALQTPIQGFCFRCSRIRFLGTAEWSPNPTVSVVASNARTPISNPIQSGRFSPAQTI